jgi:hypothetical protein
MTRTDFYTYVKVEPIIRAFFLSINNGSDLLQPSKHDALWKLVKIYLMTVPKDINPVPCDKDQYLRISLLCSHNFMREYRHYLNEEGQQVVANYLKLSFKQVMHNYIYGAVSTGKCTQLDAVKSFVKDYNISPDSIKMETLVKSWNRSDLYTGWRLKKTQKTNRVTVL